VLVAGRAALLAPRRSPAIRALLVAVVITVSSVSAVPEHVHGDESDGDQNPNPVCRYPFHDSILSCLVLVVGGGG
jgi:hypothetical protein